jgi:regulatory protein
MPQITEIKPQKSKKRVNIYIDGVFSFGLDLENFIVLGLKVGKELNEEEIAEIVKKAEFSKVFDKIIRFGMMRPRSEKEFRDWLRKYQVHESMHAELFKKLTRLELLDDPKFARWWITQRGTFKPRSKNALKYELLQKGIHREIISDALLEIKVDEMSLAKELVLKKKRMWENREPAEAKKKIQMILAGKGFGWNVAKKIIDDVLQ